MAKISEIIRAIEIFEKTEPNIRNKYICAEHDIIYFPISSYAEISEKDLEELSTMGVHISSDMGTWAVFV